MNTISSLNINGVDYSMGTKINMAACKLAGVTNTFDPASNSLTITLPTTNYDFGIIYSTVSQIATTPIPVFSAQFLPNQSNFSVPMLYMYVSSNTSYVKTASKSFSLSGTTLKTTNYLDKAEGTCWVELYKYID